MKKYGFSKNQLLVVDDMKPAYKMSSDAGVPMAFAAWGHREHPHIIEEMRHLCNHTFFTPEALEHFLFD